MEQQARAVRLGFVGVGRMGRAMASNLVRAGYEVRVYDRYAAAMEAMAEAGAIPAELPKLVKESDIILLSLPNPAIVEDVVLGSGGIFAAARAGQLLIDLSSSTPQSEHKIAAQGQAIGVDFLDAPVSGGVAGAVAGTLTIMVGGPEKLVARARPILEVLGKKIVHVGPVGTGQAVKLVNQLLFGVNMAALAEGLKLAEALGLDQNVVYEVVSAGAGNSYALQTRCPKFIFADNFEPGFSLELAAKDLRLAVSAALEAGQPLLLGALGLQLFEAAKHQGYGAKDISGIYKYLSEHLSPVVEEG
ncbi:NAD(P)-dependent oxidoreductase [Gelria sp. Kuro-4]|uniref:NAD(P)-dependent oxidoreductase n=1 Tax=Gelria sp. Kuro-4 TaxID=2796927 RepID=UPI001BEE1DE3|nr:NAD(P)-dependent oxidoreductase [Gelria sp. Kuro-4]BCV24854.1 tartronate semialdehyde reductase [Gelria sp. Kuro-4]